MDSTERMARHVRVDHGARLPQEVIRDLVAELHDRAAERPCCDPRDLAEGGMGLEPCPAVTLAPIIRDGVLHYPMHLGLDQRGIGILRLLAGLLVPCGSVVQVIRELVLPERIARCVRFADLPRIQPHAPLSLVQTVFMVHNGSGAVRL